MALSVNPADVERYLKLGSLDADTAHRRALILAEDINAIGFETFGLSAQLYPFPGSESGVRLAEYHFGDTGCSANNAENPYENRIEWFGGTGIDRGNLQFFSRVCEIGRTIIPSFWLADKKLRTALRNPTQHLSTLEEVWWLTRWRSLQNIRRGVRLRSDSEKDVDWSFHISSANVRVNLEVKRVVSDAVRHARPHARRFNSAWFSKFCAEEVLPKFRESNSNEINVLALSLFGEIDRDVQLVVSDWLKQQSRVDAVIIASREARRRADFDPHLATEKSRILRHCFAEPDKEDASLWFVLHVTYELSGSAFPPPL